MQANKLLWWLIYIQLRFVYIRDCPTLFQQKIVVVMIIM